MTVTSGTPLKLEEGYELAIKSIDIDGNKVFVSLSKDGNIVSEKVVQPSKDGATMADKTYHYKKTIGDTKEVAHTSESTSRTPSAALTRTWPPSMVYSRYPIPHPSVEVDTEYDKMRIKTVSADTITMDNKDNSITLNKNKDTALMAGIGIKTADQDDVTAENPLRFYIYKSATIEGAAAEAAPANVTAAAPVEAPAAEEKPAEDCC